MNLWGNCQTLPYWCLTRIPRQTGLSPSRKVVVTWDIGTKVHVLTYEILIQSSSLTFLLKITLVTNVLLCQILYLHLCSKVPYYIYLSHIMHDSRDTLIPRNTYHLKFWYFTLLILLKCNTIIPKSFYVHLHGPKSNFTSPT